MIVDPTNPEVALDETGEVLGAVHMLPIRDGHTPTITELLAAPIVGYSRGIASRRQDHDTDEEDPPCTA